LLEFVGIFERRLRYLLLLSANVEMVIVHGVLVRFVSQRMCEETVEHVLAIGTDRFTETTCVHAIQERIYALMKPR
jgi:hypothetical protein